MTLPKKMNTMGKINDISKSLYCPSYASAPHPSEQLYIHKSQRKMSNTSIVDKT